MRDFFVTFYLNSKQETRNKKQETRNKKQETRNKKQETRNKKQETRNKKQETRNKKQETRNKKQETRNKKQETKMNSRKDQLQAFDRLLTIMDELRAQCPWDQKQTMQTLRHLTIEETYELGDAILENDLDEVKKELGDVLLHIVFYAKIGSETSDFDIADVCNEISEKLIFRHPHIYGDVEVADEEEVKRNWENLKLKEGKKSVLEGVPKSLPALVKASRIQEKVAGVGFDWEEPQQVFEKLQEELGELQHEINENNLEKIEAEFGDVLFSMINYARFLKVNPENALERTNKKFIKRFQYLEGKAKEIDKSLKDMTLEEMDIFWNEAKTSIG
ncbi:MazG family protein [Aequorivita sublithincola DSM 14238]|uniref:Nucleoside triphosphate pyrophosphohydrolase n=2 Tax=Aequorivita TaxID=153265 RepID=I3YXM8_AEQSU|nr:MazG family protein [Aequorivita sublithincola DSM 14238]